MATTLKITVIIGELNYPFDTFEDAARFWDGETFAAPAPFGGIAVQEFDGEIMVRDGWLLHVGTDRSVYINPRMV